MKSKIEKLNIFADELSGKDYVKVLGIANKVDEIIDWINSQDQGEEKECECCKWDDMGYTHEPYCPLFKEYKQDTPEEWEKEFEFLYGHLYIQNEDGEFCKINGEVEDMIDFIKQLLEERSFSKEELAYLEEVMHLDYSLAVTFGQREKSDIGGGLLRKLDKLNNKKK